MVSAVASALGLAASEVEVSGPDDDFVLHFPLAVLTDGVDRVVVPCNVDGVVGQEVVGLYVREYPGLVALLLEHVNVEHLVLSGEVARVLEEGDCEEGSEFRWT